MIKNILLALTFFSCLSAAYSQNKVDTAEVPVWIDMMQDPKANFFETQKAFEMYWENRPIQKGSGWKPFKRWESFMESRVDVDGNKPYPGRNYDEYLKFKSAKNKGYSVQGHGNWKELGPFNMPSNGTSQPNGLGRINCVAFHPLQPNTWYVGAPSGGFWRTYNGGVNWETTTDSLATLGVSSIIVNPSHASSMLLGTGDRDGSDAPGIGVMKSLDGGDTWTLSNSGMGKRVVGKMILHPTDTNIVLAATNGGIFKSNNLGISWARVTPITPAVNYKDIVFNPTNPSIVYATGDGNYYRSTNTGDSWTQITSGFGSNISRMVIGVSADDPSNVYVLGVDNRVFEGIYLSTDNGLTFTLRSNTPNIMDYKWDGSGSGGQGWYDLCIAVDPTDINTVYAGGVNIFKSTDGGLSWKINAHWVGDGNAPEIHADQHELTYSPLDGKLYSCNDGGIYSTINGGISWIDHSSGLGIAQVYKIGQSSISPKLSINGYQDNGTSVFNGNWRTEIGGDGMECIVDYSDTNYLYGALYYGDIRRSVNNGVNFRRIAKDGSNGISESGAWVTPYILDMIDPNTMYVGYKNLWRSTNVKASSSGAVSWTKITNNLAGSNSNTIRVLEQSPANTDILYFSRADNKLLRTDNLSSASPIFVNLTSNLVIKKWPTDIEADPTNANNLWITIQNSVYYSNNKGGSWSDITTNLPGVSVNCIVYDESSAGDLYVGTDLGVYYLRKGETDWLEYNSGLPISVEVSELEIFYHPDRLKSKLKAATYGRGLWEGELFNIPEANFTSNSQVVCTGQEVHFTDLSHGTYNRLKWTFPGAIPSTSTDRNPVVIYPSGGTFDVSLEVYNDLDADTITKKSFIQVSPNQIAVSPDTTYLKFGESVTLTASGSSSYSWFPAFGLNSTTGTSVVATPVVTTTYTVYGNNGGSCDTAKSIVYVSPLGISNINKDDPFQVYPNPSDGLFTIDASAYSGNTLEVSVTDVSGKIVYNAILDGEAENKKHKVDLRTISKGILLIRIKADENTYYHKLFTR